MMEDEGNTGKRYDSPRVRTSGGLWITDVGLTSGFRYMLMYGGMRARDVARSYDQFLTDGIVKFWWQNTPACICPTVCYGLQQLV